MKDEGSQQTSWAERALDGSFLQAYLTDAEDDVVTLAPLPGAGTVMTASGEVAQSGGCCPSGSCCVSGSCCQSGSACVTVDEETSRGRRRGAARAAGQKRLWPIPV
jgi:hypothetical protein